jgi:hypothetical protein
MFHDPGTCAHCGSAIVDPTTQVVHSNQAFCCQNCAEAMKQQSSQSGGQTVSGQNTPRCAHCNTPIVYQASMEQHGDEAFCCTNCAAAAGKATGRTPTTQSSSAYGSASFRESDYSRKDLQ